MRLADHVLGDRHDRLLDAPLLGERRDRWRLGEGERIACRPRRRTFPARSCGRLANGPSESSPTCVLDPMPRGGHFAALEEPGLLADDLIEFLAGVIGLGRDLMAFGALRRDARPSNQMGVLNTDLAKQLETVPHGSRLKPRARSTRHRHRAQEELYVLLEGSGRAPDPRGGPDPGTAWRTPRRPRDGSPAPTTPTTTSSGSWSALPGGGQYARDERGGDRLDVPGWPEALPPELGG